jgi:hypothetical protein
MSFFRDLRIAVRSLAGARGLWITVALTLALGIGANAAIFSVVRGVLLRPLVNRDEGRLIYIRQSAPGIGVDNATFSVPEIKDVRDGLKTITELGTFSAINFTLTNVLREGIAMAAIGVAAGAFVGFVLSRLVGRYIQEMQLPGALPLIVSGAAILTAAVIASVVPAARAERVDTVQALRAD